MVYALMNTPHGPLHELRPDVSLDVEAIVDACLEKARADRFGSMVDVYDALTSAIERRKAPAALPSVSPAQRLALLRLGIGDTPGLVADDRELWREGPSYSADTLASLREELGGEARLVMALGHDAFLRLAEWHAPQRLFELAHLVVVERPDYQAALPVALRELIAGRESEGVEELMARPAGGLLRLRLPSRMAISATELRRRLARGLSVRYLLPEAVETHIMAHGFYRRY
ncbi:MAG TPA: nicotinate-nicotinamide nucleotide adenylyltransferase [Halomonas sp.]|nr:nicotinate-nicotinamide nucleotide adenylyltransferase [Halomonas sp.]